MKDKIMRNRNLVVKLINPLTPGVHLKGHTYINKPAAEAAGLFKYV